MLLPTDELVVISAECDRVIGGMLDGSVTRDDGLFATAATLKRIVTNLILFVTYALPILHTIDQAMRAAAAQAAQARVPQAQPAQPAAPEPEPTQTAPNLNLVPNGENIQSVDATVTVRQ